MDEMNRNELIDSDDFKDYVNNEFDKTVSHSTIEELAEYAFGSIDEALDEYICDKAIKRWVNIKLLLNCWKEENLWIKL